MTEKIAQESIQHIGFFFFGKKLYRNILKEQRG